MKEQTAMQGVPRKTPDELRADMFRLLDEIATARTDRGSVIKKEFDALWRQLPEPPSETRH